MTIFNRLLNKLNDMKHLTEKHRHYSFNYFEIKGNREPGRLDKWTTVEEKEDFKALFVNGSKWEEVDFWDLMCDDDIDWDD